MHNDSSFVPLLVIWLVASTLACSVLYSLGKYDGATDVCANMCGQHYAIENSSCICLEVKE